MKRFLSVLLCALFSAISIAEAANQPTTDALLDQYQTLVLQVKIVNIASGKKSGLGSGFFVQKQGYIVTNYHVIADLVFQPEQFQAYYVQADGSSGTLEVVSFDIVHDLALLKANVQNTDYFDLNPEPVQKGVALYSLGYPRDLGLVLLSGYHGGLIRHTLYEKIHLLGSLHKGMSGGPSFTAEGLVVGVNVAISGNQSSFLVPATFVLDMLAQAHQDNPISLLDLATDQLRQNQARYLGSLISHPMKVTSLGPYRVPDKLAPYMRCWGSDTGSEQRTYRVIEQSCATKEDIFLNAHHISGTIRFIHRLISSEQLSAFPFYALYESEFRHLVMKTEGRAEDVSRFQCQENFIVNNGLHLKIVFCARGYKKFLGLYDVIVKAATVDHDDSGLQTALLLTGVSFNHAQHFAKKYLDSITWQP